MIFIGKNYELLKQENSIVLLDEYDPLTDDLFPTPLYENWPGGAPQFLAALRARIAALKAEKATKEELKLFSKGKE